MAATEKKQMWFWSSPDGVAPEKVTRKIAASQGVFMPGAPCYISTSGTVKLADTSDGTGDTIHGFIVGLANKTTAWPITAELAANTEVEVSLIDTDDTYAVFVENNGTDAAATQAMVGDSYGLTVSTTATQIGYTTVDVNNSNTTVIVQDIMSNVNPSKYTTSTAPGIMLVKFLPANVNASKA